MIVGMNVVTEAGEQSILVEEVLFPDPDFMHLSTSAENSLSVASTDFVLHSEKQEMFID